MKNNPDFQAQDWERTLRETRFDLSAQAWENMEARLRQQIRSDAAKASAVVPSWWERLRSSVTLWWEAGARRPALVGGFAVLALAAVGGWMLHAPGVAVQTVAGLETLKGWKAGSRLQTASLHEWHWVEPRCSLSLAEGSLLLTRADKDVRLKLEKGTATFRVDPRRADETFAVQFGSCEVRVVGTAFTIRVDSLEGLAEVLHGVVRFQDAQGHVQRLTKGQHGVCRENLGGAAGRSEHDDSVERGVELASAPSSGAPGVPEPALPAVVVERPSLADEALRLEQAEYLQAAARCSNGSNDVCIEALARYLQRHPQGGHAVSAAFQWGDRAVARGDVRDALYAYSLAVSASGNASLSMQARLEAARLRLTRLGQSAQAARELDQLLALHPQGELLRQALQLRSAAAGILGDAAGKARYDSLLGESRAVVKTR